MNRAICFLPITSALLTSLSSRMSLFHRCDHISAAPERCRICFFSSRCLSDQFVHLGLDRLLQFEHDESSSWVFSVRLMQAHES
ncbi:hypothetical protein HID58_049558 [Brassica napus]|uniref:Secreted protein n=1 Tax=Brassica napus TaxID=3708 RepID=A0ABQ8B5D5_BRANA|nr:hypothetical protein HID58_049558 [Brassica napus]